MSAEELAHMEKTAELDPNPYPDETMHTEWLGSLAVREWT